MGGKEKKTKENVFREAGYVYCGVTWSEEAALRAPLLSGQEASFFCFCFFT